MEIQLRLDHVLQIANPRSESTAKPTYLQIVKMSAIADTADGPTPVIQVLFVLHPGFNLLDVTGTVEVFSEALHDMKNKGASLPHSL